MQKIGSEMKVARAEDEIEIEVFKAHLGHNAGIGQDKPSVGLRKDDRLAGVTIRKAANPGDIGTALGKARKAKFAKRIRADGRTEADAIPQKCKIVRKNRGRASECEAKIGGEVFAIELKHGGQAVKNEIEIQFSNDGEIELGCCGHGEEFRIAD